MGRQLEIEHALGIAGGLLGGRPVALDDPDLPAAAGQAGGGGATGQAGAYDQGRARALGARWAGIPGHEGRGDGAFQLAGQHFALVAEAGHLGHGEAGLVETTADGAGAGKGRQGGAGMGQPRQFGEQRGRPHLGVLGRGEAVQEPGIAPGIQFGQALQHIADQQGQGDAPVAQDQPLEAWMDRLVLPLQRRAVGGEFRPETQRLGEIGGGQRKALDADEMQARFLWCQGVEKLPGAEEVEAGAETRLADGEDFARRQRGEAFGQAILLQEDIARLFQTAGAGKIDVAIGAGEGLPGGIPVELGVLEIGHERRGLGFRARSLKDRAQAVRCC